MGTTIPQHRDRLPCLPPCLRRHTLAPIPTAPQMLSRLEWQLNQVTTLRPGTHPISLRSPIVNTLTTSPQHLCHIHPRMASHHQIRGQGITTTDRCLFHKEVTIPPRCQAM